MRPFALLLLVACAGGEPPARRQVVRGDARATGEIVATVEGYPVRRAEVTALARRGRLAPRQALDRLEGELLLALEAEQEGYAGEVRVRREARRAAVQALLREVAAEVSDEVSEEDLRALYEERVADWRRSAQRGVVHVLVPVAEGAPAAIEEAARVRAQAVLLALAQDPDLERWRSAPDLVVEEVPLFGPDAPLEASFREAAFALEEPGVVPRVVRTSYGWHVIVVRVVLPEFVPSFESRRRWLRDELLAQRRFARLHALVERLERERGVTRHEVAIRHAMALELGL